MNVSRRAFLSRSSLGIALAGAAMAVPGLSTVLKAPSPSIDLPIQSGGAEPLVAHVRDLASGELSLMVGTEHVVVRDPSLAGRLYGALNAPRSRER